MIEAQNSKVVVVLGPVTAATNADSTNYFDALGFDYAVVDVAVPPATATNSSAKLQVLAFTEGDTTSSFAAWTGTFTGTTNSTAAATEFVLPVHNNTSIGGIHRFYIDLRARKRYIKIADRPAASHTIVYASVSLSRGEIAPDTDTERGVLVSVTG